MLVPLMEKMLAKNLDQKVFDNCPHYHSYPKWIFIKEPMT